MGLTTVSLSLTNNCIIPFYIFFSVTQVLNYFSFFFFHSQLSCEGSCDVFHCVQSVLQFHHPLFYPIGSRTKPNPDKFCRVFLKKRMGRNIFTRSPSWLHCLRSPNACSSCTPTNLVLKMWKWYRILARYDHGLYCAPE